MSNLGSILFGNNKNMIAVSLEGEDVYSETISDWDSGISIVKTNFTYEASKHVRATQDYITYELYRNGDEFEYTTIYSDKANVPATLVIPESLNGFKVTIIADKLFHKVSTGVCDIESVTLGANIRSIGKEVFYNCDKLTEVVLNEGLKTIGEGAFKYCDGITEIYIPASVETITATKLEDAMFYASISLAKIELGNYDIPDGFGPYWNYVRSSKIITPTWNGYDMATLMVADTSNVEEIIASAKAGSTIVLSKGNYSLIELKGLNAFKDNITITAVDGVTVDGLLITSGLTKAEYLNEEKTSAILGENLTITNITFLDDIQVRNCTLSGLTISDCKFTGEARIIVRANEFFAIYKTNPSARDGDIPKFGMDDNAMVSGTNISNEIINITIENNTLEGVHDSILDNSTVIYLCDVNGATVKNNIIEDAEFNGIQVTSGITSYGSYYSRGQIVIEGNIIKSSGSRSIRLSYYDDSAQVLVKNNVLSNANTNPKEAEENSEVIKSSSTGNATIVFEGNTYNGEDISEGNGITKA